MYRSGRSDYTVYSEARDFSVALYLEDPSITAKTRNRRYINQQIANGSSLGYTYSYWTIRDMCGFVFHTYPDGTPSGNVRLTLSSNTYGTLVDKTIPYSTNVGISMTELPQEVLSHLSDTDTFAWRIYNLTGVPIYLCYVTPGPLLFLNSLSGLKAVNCGEAMGNDEYLPEFGVSHMYGSFEVQDKRRVILGLVTNPTAYGLDADLPRYSLRCEVFVGTQLAGILLVDEFSFSEDNQRVRVTLKSVLLDLDSIPGLGPRVAYMSQSRTLQVALTEYFAYSKSMYPDVLSQYDFGGICDNELMLLYTIIGPMAVVPDTTVLGFMEKVGQAVGCTIGIRHVLTTTMQYQFSLYGWTGESTGMEQNLGFIAYQYGYLRPHELIGELEYTPIRKNYIDKITYSQFEVGVSENAQELSVDYELINLKGYASATTDKSEFLAYWKGLSQSAKWPENNALETTYGMRVPRPSDVSYNSSAAKYVANYAELEKSEARALTRGFLWRFEFATSFKNSRFSSTSVSSVLSSMRQKAVYGGDGNYNNAYMMFPHGTAYKMFTGREFTYYGWNGSAHNVKVTLSAVSKTFTVSRLFDYMPSLYTLHIKIPAGYYVVDEQSYTINQYFSYWFSPVYGFNPWTRKDEWTSEDRAWTPLPNFGEYAYTVNNQVQEWDSKMEKISDYFTLMATANQYTAYTLGHAGPLYKRDVNAVFNTYNYGDPYSSGSVKMVGTNMDIDGGYGAPWGCFNTDDSEHSGENTIWPAYDPAGIEDNKHWFHTGFGDDTTAKGNANYVKVTQRNVSAQTIFGHNTEQDEHGNVFVEWPLPSSSTLRSAIMSGEDNFLNKRQKESESWVGTEDTGYGLDMSNQANAYCDFWSVGAVSSIMGRTEMIYRSDDVSSDFSWRNPRPSYGYCVKGVRYSISGRFLEIRQGETHTVQYNKQNQYNYDMATNELMTDRLSISRAGIMVNALSWLLSDIATRFSKGKTVYWAKCKVKGLYKGSTSSAAPFVRNYYLRDTVYQVYVSRNGSNVNMLRTSSARVYALEYVMENGECYVNLRLMDN